MQNTIILVDDLIMNIQRMGGTSAQLTQQKYVQFFNIQITSETDASVVAHLCT